VGFSSQVLPVVGVDAIFFIVVVRQWTPSSLEVKDVKIRVFWLYLMQEVDSNFIFRMRKSTNLAVLAVFQIIRISLTKFTFIFFRMIKFFNSVVSFQARLAIRYTLVMRGTA
jgi:hypothetical protein